MGLTTNTMNKEYYTPEDVYSILQTVTDYMNDKKEYQAFAYLTEEKKKIVRKHLHNGGEVDINQSTLFQDDKVHLHNGGEYYTTNGQLQSNTLETVSSGD